MSTTIMIVFVVVILPSCHGNCQEAVLQPLIVLLPPRVHNKERKRVSNTLYTVCYNRFESNVTSRLVHVSMQNAEKVKFYSKYESRGAFRAFSDRFCLYARFCPAL